MRAQKTCDLRKVEQGKKLSNGSRTGTKRVEQEQRELNRNKESRTGTGTKRVEQEQRELNRNKESRTRSQRVEQGQRI